MNIKTLAILDGLQNNSKQSEQIQQLSQLLDLLAPNQKLWLSGYLAADAANVGTALQQPHSTAPQITDVAQLTVLYGSQTGNGKKLANKLQQLAKSIGVNAELFSLADISVKQLSKKQLITLVISTHGEGEAPDDAEMFYEQLFNNKAPKLTELQYSILALGDSSYELFCETGIQIDQRFQELGAKRIHPRVDCDVDFELAANQWIAEVLSELDQSVKLQKNNITTLPIQQPHNNNQLASKNQPFTAEILALQKITGRGSIKNTYHIELEIDPKQIQYQPGDSLGVISQNNAKSVQKLLDYWQLTGSETIEFKQQSAQIAQLLTDSIEITQVSKPLVQYMAKQLNDDQLTALATSHQAYTDYCHKHQLIDLLQQFDAESNIALQDVLHQLKSITPRLYSIASAQSVYEDEVHLTINLEETTETGDYGLVSGLLCHEAKVGDEIKVYVEPNQHFKLPENTQTAVIMIGAGTGIAPYRSFLQQRVEQAASGENWLVFGNPNFNSDFLYQAEWLKLQQQGSLNHIDVAFSRDQAEKIYIQHKLKAQAEKVWQWLQSGAYLYVCGDANQMAKDVEQTLTDIIAEQGQMPPDEAKNYLKQLKRTQKYQKDVY